VPTCVTRYLVVLEASFSCDDCDSRTNIIVRISQGSQTFELGKNGLNKLPLNLEDLQSPTQRNNLQTRDGEHQNETKRPSKPRLRKSLALRSTFEYGQGEP
jgi:hypothetical protein